MLYIYFLFILFIILYLTGFFDNYQTQKLVYNAENTNSLIEFLSKDKTKTKNYTNPPENYSSYSIRPPVGKILKDKVQFRYEFPLIKSKKAVYDCFLFPSNISSQIDLFGLKNDLIKKNKDGFSLKENISNKEFSKQMNRFGWFFNSISDYGVDYKFLVKNYVAFTKPISKLIYNELSAIGKDNYVNRVQATLNFVQFLHYGLPNFDSDEWYYFGITTPPESFILGYSDCDSKSIFFASILSELIPIENIILINCKVNSTNEASDGNHMMVAVSDLNIVGETVYYNDKKFLLLETTAPTIIGEFGWQSFELLSIIDLN